MSRCRNLGILGAALATAALMTPRVAAAAAPRRHSRKTSPRSSRTSAKRVIGPIRSRRCRSSRTRRRGPGRARSRAASSARQMPPWHIDKTVGIQEFKNDRSLSDEADRRPSCKWVDAGAPKGDPKDMPAPKEWPNEQGWNFAAHVRPEGTRPDHPSTPWTQKAGANDTWWKPVVETGITEPRWVRAIEIRPATVKGRKITHHAIARLQQDETDRARRRTTIRTAPPQAGTFMEWAVGKQGEMHAAEHRQADAARLEDRLGHPLLERRRGHHRHRRTRHLLLPEGPGAEVPPGAAPDGRTTSAGGVDIPPNTVKATEGFFVLRENGRIESFQPHMHLRGKAMAMKRSCRPARCRC